MLCGYLFSDQGVFFSILKALQIILTPTDNQISEDLDGDVLHVHGVCTSKINTV